VTAGHYVIGGGLPSPIPSASPIVDGIKNGTRFPKKEMGESHSHSSSIDSLNRILEIYTWPSAVWVHRLHIVLGHGTCTVGYSLGQMLRR
jgi:hypothetical protein